MSMRIGPLFQRLYEAYMRRFTEALHEQSAYHETVCAECPHGHICCTSQVWITPFEAEAIAWFLSTAARFKTAALAPMRRRIAQRAAEIRENNHGHVFGEPRKADEAAWFDKGRYCVFYDQAKRRCAIYPVRPMSCRKAFAATGDHCARDGWRSAQEEPEAFMRRIQLLLIGGTYEENFGELTNMLERVTTPGREPFHGPDLLALMNAAKSGNTPSDESMFCLLTEQNDRSTGEVTQDQAKDGARAAPSA